MNQKKTITIRTLLELKKNPVITSHASNYYNESNSSNIRIEMSVVKSNWYCAISIIVRPMVNETEHLRRTGQHGV